MCKQVHHIRIFIYKLYADQRNDLVRRDRNFSDIVGWQTGSRLRQYPRNQLVVVPYSNKCIIFNWTLLIFILFRLTK